MKTYIILGMLYALYSTYIIKDTDEYKKISNNTLCMFLWIITLIMIWPFVIVEIISKIIKKLS